MSSIHFASNWHHPKLGPMSKFNPFSTPMNPNESFGFAVCYFDMAISMLALLASGENRSGLKLNGSPNSPPQYLD